MGCCLKWSVAGQQNIISVSGWFSFCCGFSIVSNNFLSWFWFFFSIFLRSWHGFWGFLWFQWATNGSISLQLWMTVKSKISFSIFSSFFFWVKYPHYIHVISTNRNREFISIFMNHFNYIIWKQSGNGFYPFAISVLVLGFVVGEKSLQILYLIDESRPQKDHLATLIWLCWSADVIYSSNIINNNDIFLSKKSKMCFFFLFCHFDFQFTKWTANERKTFQALFLFIRFFQWNNISFAFKLKMEIYST